MADLQVGLDEVATLAIAETLSAPTIGEFTREGFVQGWKSLQYVLDTGVGRCA